MSSTWTGWCRLAYTPLFEGKNLTKCFQYLNYTAVRETYLGISSNKLLQDWDWNWNFSRKFASYLVEKEVWNWDYADLQEKIVMYKRLGITCRWRLSDHLVQFQAHVLWTSIAHSRSTSFDLCWFFLLLASQYLVAIYRAQSPSSKVRVLHLICK